MAGVMGLLMACLAGPAPAHAAPATVGLIRVHVRKSADQQGLEDLVVEGVDDAGRPILKPAVDTAPDGSAGPTLGCALFAERERRDFGLDAGALPPARRFQAPVYSDRAGGTCEFANVPKGKYAVIVVVERSDADRDLNMTFSNPWMDVLPDALVRQIPGWMLRLVPDRMAEWIGRVQVAPTEDWAASRADGRTREPSIDFDRDPPRPRYREARFRFPGRGEREMTLQLRRLE